MKTNTQNFKYYDLVVAFSASIPLLSNLAATKPIQFGPLLLDAGFLLFPLAYIFDDILTEVYGFRHARRAIWCGFIVMLVGVSYLSFAVGLPAASGYTDQEAYAKVFGFLPVLVGGSMLAYLAGSFLNAAIVSWMKEQAEKKPDERPMWHRLMLSTVWGELADTFVFSVVYSLLFGLTLRDFFVYLLVGYVWKVFVEAVMMWPVTLPVIRWIKRREGVEIVDRDIRRSLFSLSVQR